MPSKPDDPLANAKDFLKKLAISVESESFSSKAVEQGKVRRSIDH